MSNRIKVDKIVSAMAHFERSLKYVNRKIDEKARNGKYNENDSDRHFSGTTNDGSRCWSY